MLRKIVTIDPGACNGCGLCVHACHEGAIGLNENNKAVLLRDDYCDGLGDCLPVCPVGAISFEERDTLAYDDEAVRLHMMKDRPLQQWPIQLKLVSVNAPSLNNAHLLIAADCTAYAYDQFHRDFMRGRIPLIGCPKLDKGDYSDKLTALFTNTTLQSITIARMEVPCCSGLEYAVRTALKNSGKSIPCHVVTISTEGLMVAR